MPKRLVKVYIAGPYSAHTHEERMENIARFERAALPLIAAGLNPLIPVHSHYTNRCSVIETGRDVPYETWMALDFDWLDACDCLLFLDSSPGADREQRHAYAACKPVFYNVATLLEYYGAEGK